MPIKNLTDRNTLKPSFPRLGKLRKGGKKKGNTFGDDLDHFRFTSNNPEVEKAFNEIYGKEPRIVNAVMCYHTYEECFSSWIECWDASGLVFRSDGENWHIWRDGDKYKRGKKAHTDGKGQDEVGRLEFIIPELWDMGFRGTVTLETHSNHDLRNIGGVLLMAEEHSETLRGLPFVLRRVKEEISTPGWGDRKGQRSRTEKWLVKLEPPRQLLMLETPTETALLSEPVDEITGEIIDMDGVTKAAVEDFGGVEITQELQAAMDYVTKKGKKRLGDCTPEELTPMLDWCNENTDNPAAQMMKGHIEILLEYMKSFEAPTVNNILHPEPPVDV